MNVNVTIQLKTPQALKGWLSSTVPVTNVHLAADEPERLASELGKRINI